MPLHGQGQLLQQMLHIDIIVGPKSKNETFTFFYVSGKFAQKSIKVFALKLVAKPKANFRLKFKLTKKYSEKKKDSFVLGGETCSEPNKIVYYAGSFVFHVSY